MTAHRAGDLPSGVSLPLRLRDRCTNRNRTLAPRVRAHTRLLSDDVDRNRQVLQFRHVRVQ